MIKVNYKNENDIVLFTKHINDNVKVADIVKDQTENLWVSINIQEIDLLDEIDLMDIGDSKIRITYSFSIDELIPSNERQFDYIAEMLDVCLNNYAETISNIFNKNEISILWGGPGVPDVNSELKLDYYIDNNCSFVLLSMNITPSDLTDNFRVNELVSNANQSSELLQQVIDSIKLSIK